MLRHLDWAGTPNAHKVRRHPEIAPYRLEEMADHAIAVLDAVGWNWLTSLGIRWAA